MKQPDLDKIVTGEEELKKQLDAIKLTIASDLKLVNNGKIDKLKILNLEDQLYKRIADLIKLTKLQKLEKTDEEPEKLDNLPKETKKTKFTLPPGGNIYEHVVEEVKKNGRPNV